MMAYCARPHSKVCAAIKVCNKVGVDTSYVLTGGQVEAMSDQELAAAVAKCDLFAKLSPIQKERVVASFQEMGFTVGYMGDGINDAPALRQADVGISVDNAVDIAKETADIILLEKDLMVLEEGVISGRKTFGNISKYIKMATSGNLGNMISVLVASVFLPFLPMLPVQILTQNLLNDFSQIGMPFDRMDDDYVRLPRKWDTTSIKSFMFSMGPLSSLFDLLCFAVLYWVFGWQTAETAPLFHAGWFVFGTVSQVVVIHIIRTAKIPFLQSLPSRPLVVSTFLVTIVSLFVAFTEAAQGIDMMRLPLSYMPWLVLLLTGYFLAAQLMKNSYIKKYGYWI
jgi:Mg2+-importing ATPase